MKEPIRVLNLFTIMDCGGAETMIMNYYRKMDRTKIQFDFIVHRDQRAAYDEEILALGGRIFRMCPIYPQNFRKYRKMLSLFFQHHPEYGIIHSHMAQLGCFAFIEAKKAGVPARICHAHSAPDTFTFDLKMPVRNCFKRIMRPYITHMFVCGQKAGDWLYGQSNREKFVMMNNAIDACRFAYDETVRESVRRELNIENQFVIGHVGRFATPKNHDKLIDIFFEIHKMEPESVLLLIGMGELLERIQKKVVVLHLEDSVLFLGARSDIHRYLQAMDCFVFPSIYEGLPLSVIEAQAAGLPCLISNGISDQCIITDLVRVLPLEMSETEWASRVVECSSVRRTNRTEEIIKAHFDVTENVRWLEEFYLNLNLSL